MSFVSMNTKSPLTPDLAQMRARAKEAKQNVQGTVGQFQKIDTLPQDKSPETDIVVVTPDNPAALPKTEMEQLGDKIKDKFKDKSKEEAPAPEKMATGYSRADSKGVAQGDVVVTEGDKSQSFNYKRMEDGTEVYHGPTGDGYAVVRENASQGTLFVELSDEPNQNSFQKAVSPGFTGPKAANDRESSKPKTLKESLRVASQMTTTSGEGTYLEGVEQRAKMMLDVGESVGKAVSGLFGGLFGADKKK